jgi:TP53 regulating kinase-like protein
MLADQIFENRLGAEARIELVEWCGRPAIRKIRIPKAYRSESLDRKLRARRTKQETELLHQAKLVRVDVPEIFFADPQSSEIIMEFVQGTLLKDIQERKIAKEIYTKLGVYAARLHSQGMIHGDLTTKNVIQSGTRTVLIDFGLAFISDRLEDKAEDLHLLKQAIRSSGSSLSTRYFDYVLAGYEREAGQKETMRLKRQILEIERRGRYARVD